MSPAWLVRAWAERRCGSSWPLCERCAAGRRACVAPYAARRRRCAERGQGAGRRNVKATAAATSQHVAMVQVSASRPTR
jgi:hypothetical protein